MKRKLLALLLALTMIISLVPTVALAAEGDVTETCTVTEGCTLEDGHEGECVLSGEDNDADDDAIVISAIQERINALPDADTLADMDEDELAEVYVEVCDIYDAIDELTDEQADMLDVSALEDAAAFFTQQIMPLESEEDTDSSASGTSGGISWSITDGVLTISKATTAESGSTAGEITDYSGADKTPWYSSASSITSITVESGVTKIGNWSLAGFENLVSISLPEGLVTIGQHSMRNNPKLTAVSLPSTVTSVGNYWMQGDKSITSFSVANSSSSFKAVDGVLFSADGTTLYAYPAGNTRTSYEVPSDVTTIANCAFGNAANLQSVTLPSGLTTLNPYAFVSCTALTSISIPSGVKTIGNQAFYGCTALSTVTLVSGLETIGQKAFVNCTSLTNISLPTSLTKIDQYAFQGSGLTSIEVPASVTSMVRAFQGATNLQSAIVYGAPTDIASTGDYGLFYDCTNLKTVRFIPGANVTFKLGPSAFYSSGVHSIDLSAVTGTLTLGTDVAQGWLGGISQTFIVYTQNKVALPTSSSTVSGNSTSASHAVNAVLNGGVFGKDAIFESSVLSTPEKAGYSLNGWYTQSNNEKTYITADSNGKYTVTAPNTYYADWKFDEPTISVETNTTSITSSGTATLTAIASHGLGEDALSYQWYKGGTDETNKISGATASTYTVQGSDLSSDNSATYYCVVTATNGSDTATSTSNAVTIKVVENESSITIGAGDGISFGATYGDGPVTYHYTCTDGITPTVTSSNTEVATAEIDTDAKTVTLTILKAGTTDITVSFDGDDSYTAASDTVTFRVGKAYPELSILANGKSELTLSGGGTVTLTISGVPDEIANEIGVNYINNADDAEQEGSIKYVTPVNGVYSVSLENKTADYTFSVDFWGNDNYGTTCATCEVSVTYKNTSGGGGGSSSGSSSSNTTTTTTKNDDGSTTTTVTNKTTGTVTETTKNTDGSTLVVVTEKDGTVTTTETTVDKVVVKTVDEPGEDVTATVTIPRSVGTATVTIPADTTPGTVAVDAKTGEIVKLSVPTEAGLTVKLDGSASLILVDNSKDFTDTDGHWAEDAIDFATAHGMFGGTSDTTFTPNATMTRAMLMTVLARFDGHDTEGGSVWYEKGMEWAKANGVSDGTNPNGNITREQFAAMLYRYAGSPAVSGSIDHFSDAGNVSSYATDAMRWAVSTGIIGGMGDGTLAPQGNATRAQVATMLMRFCTHLTK